MPDQEAIDELREEARREALAALAALEQFVRRDEGMGGIDAMIIASLAQRAIDKVRVYRTVVNLGDEPEQREWLADIENATRRGMGRRRWDL